MGRGAVSSGDLSALNDLEQRLDLEIKTNFPQGAFLRLCGRSPKDGEPLDRTAVRARYAKELDELSAAGMDPTAANTRYRAVLRVPWMQVCTGSEAMSLLLTSERVFADLHDWLKFGEPEQVVLRQWEPDLRLENEFRAFVYEGKLAAVSQYDHYGVFDDLEEHMGRIEELIRVAWKALHPHVGEATYACDWVYLPASDSVTLVELSPFRNCTGAACFRWDSDRAILQAEAPFEFRRRPLHDLPLRCPQRVADTALPSVPPA